MTVHPNACRRPYFLADLQTMALLCAGHFVTCERTPADIPLVNDCMMEIKCFTVLFHLQALQLLKVSTASIRTYTYIWTAAI